MNVNIKKRLGKSVASFTFEEGKLKDALYTAAGITSIPEVCGNCHKGNLQLQSNKADKDGKTYKYVKVRCMDCSATSTMGENLDGVNIFWKKFELYNPNNGEEEGATAQPVAPRAPALSAQQPAAPAQPPIDDDDIPF